VIKIGFDITPQKREQNRQQKYMEYLENTLNEAGVEPDRTLPGARDKFGLTGREIEVLRLLAQGFTNVHIAQILGLSPHTIKTHVNHVYGKLGVGDRAQAAVWAARLELV
jgi:DNA-binding CsgD family transcriptional regulator